MDDAVHMKQTWDMHWDRMEKKNLFTLFVEWYRKNIIAREVAHFIERNFPSSGIFVECGSGTSQTSSRIMKGGRKIYAADISYSILLRAKQVPVVDDCVNCDIFMLPFKGGSIDGIWNVGVMEHFREEEIKRLLKIFFEVLKKDGKVILLWPAFFGPSNILFASIEGIVRIIFKKTLDFFPEEHSLVRSWTDAHRLIGGSGFGDCRVHWSWRGGFIHFAIILEK